MSIEEQSKTEQLVTNLKERSIQLSQQIKENDFQREFFNAKGRHLKVQLALTEKHLEGLGHGQQALPEPSGQEFPSEVDANA